MKVLIAIFSQQDTVDNSAVVLSLAIPGPRGGTRSIHDRGSNIFFCSLKIYALSIFFGSRDRSRIFLGPKKICVFFVLNSLYHQT